MVAFLDLANEKAGKVSALNPLLKLVRAYEPRFRFLRLIPQGGQVLDCGSGDFKSTGKLLQSRQDLHWHAVDINPRDQVPGDVTFSCVDLEKEKIPYPDEYFDAIYALHLAEHIRDLRHLGKEIRRVLKPGRHVYIEVPSLLSLFAPSSTKFFAKTGNFYDDLTHTRIFTKVALQEFVQSWCHLEVVRIGAARNPMKILATPALAIYSLVRWRAFVMVGIGDLVGLRLFCIGRAI